MKNYIFLNSSIANIGGAELYISHKCDHLKTIGYNVYVFSYESGNVVIKNLKEHERFVLPELKVMFRRSNSVLRHKVTRAFRELSLEGDTIIESNIDNLNLWGEFIAKKIGAYHICYLLPENNNIAKSDRDFYKFKYTQKALWGITPHTISDSMQDGGEYKDTFLLASGCTADVVDSHSIFNVKGWKNANYSILSLGRMNKPYIPSMLNSVLRFSQKVCPQTVNLLVIGGYLSEEVSDLLKECQNKAYNLVVYNIGELNPIPSNIFDMADVAIAVAGCTYICYKQGLPVVTIDANDFKGIGLYKDTTDNNSFRSNEPVVDVEDLLYMVLVDRKYGRHDKITARTSKDIDYSKHDELLNTPTDFTYFKVSHKPDSIIAFISKIAIALLGCRCYFNIIKLIKG